jgi:hypothetical protein
MMLSAAIVIGLSTTVTVLQLIHAIKTNIDAWSFVAALLYTIWISFAATCLAKNGSSLLVWLEALRLCYVIFALIMLFFTKNIQGWWPTQNLAARNSAVVKLSR